MSKLWNTIHQKYASQDWIDTPSLFAQSAIKYFPPSGYILDIGAGQGQDSRFFAEKGYSVLSTDYSEVALRINREKALEIDNYATRDLDLSSLFPFEDNSFDAVYSHLAVHYFSRVITHQLFREINRVLKLGGKVALLTNSTSDPEYGTGQKIEDDLYEVSPGFVKRFFSIDSMNSYTHNFQTLLLDTKGETYKDNAIGVKNLIRYIGEK